MFKYSKIMKRYADEIEDYRIDIYSGLHIDLVEIGEDRPKIDDMLFLIQSKLRDVTEILEYYETE